MAPVITEFVARAVRWAHGWELHVDGVGVTQVRTLGKAEQQVRDLVETMTGKDVSDAKVTVVPDVGDLTPRIVKAHRDAERAREQTAAAAREMRSVVRDLRVKQHLSVSDTAKVLGVSRGRVSQLAGKLDGEG